MKSIHLTTLILSSVLLSGCAKISGNSYCDISSPMYFEDEVVVDMLMHEDRKLLTDILIHNETFTSVCGNDT